MLVTGVAPLKAYFFSECLVRFAGGKWHMHPESIPDPLLHLCNHTLQCQLSGYNAGDGLEGTLAHHHAPGSPLSRSDLNDGLKRSKVYGPAVHPVAHVCARQADGGRH